MLSGMQPGVKGPERHDLSADHFSAEVLSLRASWYTSRLAS